MAIFFQCSCGQDLRADECNEGGKTECPACGSVVPVPSLALANLRLGIKAVPELEIPSRRETPPAPPAAECAALPDSPQPRSRTKSPGQKDVDEAYPLLLDVGGTDECWRELERREARRVLNQARDALEARPVRRQGWQLETWWFQCLLYPVLRAWPISLGLAFIWATLATVYFTALRPEYRDLTDWSLDVLGPRLPFLLVAWFLLGYACAFFRCVLASAAAGEADCVRWPGGDAVQVLWSTVACLVCFLAGPVVPLVVAFLFWLNGGDLEWVDWLILWELGLAAAAYWALTLLAVDQSGRLRDANPIAVVRLVNRFGWRGWLVVVLAAVGVAGCYYFTLGSLEALHRGAEGFFGLVWWGFVGQAWIVFLLRWLGVSQFRAKEKRKRERATPDEKPPPAPILQPHRAASEEIPPDELFVG
jgi:hypothetical protein